MSIRELFLTVLEAGKFKKKMQSPSGDCPLLWCHGYGSESWAPYLGFQVHLFQVKELEQGHFVSNRKKTIY